MKDKKTKVDALYELREASEAVGRAEVHLENDPSVEHVNKLLDAKLNAEEKTSEAIENCEHCGLQHCDHQRPAISNGGDKVIAVDFRRNRLEFQPEQEGT